MKIPKLTHFSANPNDAVKLDRNRVQYCDKNVFVSHKASLPVPAEMWIGVDALNFLSENFHFIRKDGKFQVALSKSNFAKTNSYAIIESLPERYHLPYDHFRQSLEQNVVAYGPNANQDRRPLNWSDALLKAYDFYIAPLAASYNIWHDHTRSIVVLSSAQVSVCAFAEHASKQSLIEYITSIRSKSYAA
jgi:hypothetical protein